MSTRGSLPALSAWTLPLEEPFRLAGHLPPDVTAAWLHGDDGLVAVGEAARIETCGPSRFRDAGTWFEQLVARATVADEVRVRGSGLTAFGTFAFSPDSSRRSTLVVPEWILGSHEGSAFITRVARPDAADADADPRAAGRAVFTATPRADQDSAVRLATDVGRTPYARMVEVARAAIGAGSLEKVVLSRRVRATSSRPLQPAALLAELNSVYPTTWTYLVDGTLGASPEMLAQTQGRRAFSRVLAGTFTKSPGTEPTERQRRAFAEDAKEQHEHEVAIASVLSCLEPLAEHVTWSEEPFVLRLPNVEHLASDVNARLRDGVSLLDVVDALHPSAAVCGTPEPEAAALIADLEPVDRGRYAGPVGWVNADGDGQFALALRMADLVSACEAHLHAGGGVMADSDPEREVDETVGKMRPLADALGASLADLE